ncbi:MAG: DUF1934 domain-containing protein [Clostridiales bacterium]|nr:DUF1934 domain-containing protein [Clostridiales bacterium]
MTREVLIRVTGLHEQPGQDSDNLEMITTGDYFQKNGKHYVIYDEMMEGIEGSVRNTVKISPQEMDIRKQGAIGAHMIFAPSQKSQTRYATPMGEMLVELSTNEITLDEQEDSLKVCVNYSLDINYQHISNCNITMDICSREKAQLQLAQ